MTQITYHKTNQTFTATDKEAFVCGKVTQNQIYISGFSNGEKTGTGAALLRFAVEILKKRYNLDKCSVRLVARSEYDTEKLVEYYKKLGFISLGVNPDFPEEGVCMEASCNTLLP